MKIVYILVEMQKFYGTGTMLHPDKKTIEAIATDSLRKSSNDKKAFSFCKV